MTFERLDFAGKIHDNDNANKSEDSEYEKEINGFYSYDDDHKGYYNSDDDNDQEKNMADLNDAPKEEATVKMAKPSPQKKRPSLLSELIAQSQANLGAAVISGGTDLQSIEEGSAMESVSEEFVELSIASASKPPIPRRTSFRQSALNNIAKEITTCYDMLKLDNDRLVQVSLRNFSYYIPMKMDKATIPTIFNQSVPYAAFEVVRRIHRYVWRDTQKDAPTAVADGRTTDWTPTTVEDVVLPYSKRPVLKDINLALKPGHTYLVLGPPGYVGRWAQQCADDWRDGI
jgi:ABC-type multidrug transport system fused ATPase/permease subunit